MSKRIAVVMHRWVGYLHGVQLGIAEYAVLRPDWVLAHFPPDSVSLHQLEGMSVDGVITYPELDYIPQLKAMGMPVVDVSNWLTSVGFPRVLPDDAAIGTMAAEYLCDLGLRQMGVAGYAIAEFYRIRREAFQSRCTEAAVPVSVYDEQGPVPPDQQTPVGLNPHLLAWLRAIPKPAGIFCCNDVTAAEVLDICRHTDIRVPEDLCVLGVDNDELISRTTHPPLSSIAVHTQKIGYEAAHLLDELMAGRDGSDVTRLLPPVGVVARQSTNLLAITDPDVLAAVRYIRDNIHKHVTVGQLLRLVPVNRRFLERRFKQHLGRSPLQEIRRVRIEKAKELLAGTDLSMPAIAKRSGFSNPERLANVFHDIVGMTPTHYRRQFRLMEN